MRERSQGVEVVDDRTVRFHFNAPFLDFPIMLGTSNACGAGLVVPGTTTRRLGNPVSCRSRSAPVPIVWYRWNPA